jgi:hypothetical protein
MLNLFQHLTKSWSYETLKRVQGDRLGLFMRPSKFASAFITKTAKIKYQSTGT